VTPVQIRAAPLDMILKLCSLDGEGLKQVKEQKDTGYPRIITSLPEADIQFKGIRAWIMQGENTQLVFFEMEPSAVVPEHIHEYPQWGMVIDGEMNLITNGKSLICTKGTEYLIPARVKHYARFYKETRVVDFFSEKSRYRKK
jgi:quercetin dioxygenase-like cupin family protein